jgi:sugar phosphate isomerase/epimerase
MYLRGRRLGPHYCRGVNNANASGPTVLGPNDLVWDHMSRPPDSDPVERVHAAAAAGFAGIGLFVRRWRQIRTDPDHIDRLDDALRTTGLRLWGMEVVPGWQSDGSLDDEGRAFEEAAWEMRDKFGCAYIQAIGRDVGTPAEAAHGFGALCDRAAEHGVNVALEFVPEFTDIGTAAQALEVVERAGRSNGGFCVDSWHLTRSTNNPDDILALPGDRIFCIQLNDGPIVADDPDYYTDTISNRVAPGSGQFDLETMVRNLDTIGAQCPVSLEVCSSALWAGPVETAAQTVADGMRGVLSRARS